MLVRGNNHVTFNMEHEAYKHEARLRVYIGSRCFMFHAV